MNYGIIFFQFTYTTYTIFKKVQYLNQWQKQNWYSRELKQKKQVGLEKSTSKYQQNINKPSGKYYVFTLQIVRNMWLINQILREKILENSGSWDMNQNALNQSDCSIFKLNISLDKNNWKTWFFAYWYRFIENRVCIRVLHFPSKRHLLFLLSLS